MRSPFGIFRKHGTILTAGLVVLCMFAFTLADFLKPQHFPMILAMAAFAAIFYLFGQPSGKGSWYAIAGAVLGLVLVTMIVPNAFGPAPAATTTVGNLSEEELREKVDRRRAANEFMQNVVQTGIPTIEEFIKEQQPSFDMNDARMAPLYLQIFREPYQRYVNNQARSFIFASPGEPLEVARQATVQEWVMAHEADEIGIRVSDKAVEDYLRRASNGKLSSETLTKLRKDLNMSEAQLYDLLRYHIKAQQYLMLTYPSTLTPPQQMWSYYKRTTVDQDMELATIPVDAFVDQVAEPTDAELSAYFELHKARELRGFITPQEGWTEPVELMEPEPSFLMPRKIRLAYLTTRMPEINFTDDQVKAHYQANVQKYPNPAYQQPLDPTMPPTPRTPDGPAVAQKPLSKIKMPAWAQKREFLTYEQAKDSVRADMVFEAQQTAREINEERISSALALMSQLRTAWQKQGDNKKSPQEISAELKTFAEKNGMEYTVPPEAWTAEKMTAMPIGKAVEVDVNANPQQGQLKATVRTNGANVVHLVFNNSDPEDLFRPNQVISRNEIDTRYAYWKIEDHEQYVPEWGKLSDAQREEVVKAWKINKARELAEKRAEALSKAVAEHFKKQPEDMKDTDLRKALEELKEKTITGKEGGTEIPVDFTPAIRWMQQDEQRGLRLGGVIGVPKAGQKFMETAFNDFKKPGDVDVLVNADATAYFVGVLENRRYGAGDSLDSLREAFLEQTSSPALQAMNGLVNQESQELLQKWRQDFEEKFKIQVTMPKPQE